MPGDVAGATLSIPDFTRPSGVIPDINVMDLWGEPVSQAGVQYETIHRFAELMGRMPPPHRHADCLQIHVIESGKFDFILDEERHAGTGPAVFFTPPAVPHAFSLCGDAIGHVLTVRQDLLWQMARHHDLPVQREALRPFCADLSCEKGQETVNVILSCFSLLAPELRSTAPSRQGAVRLLAAFIVAKVLELGTQNGQASASGSGQPSLYRRFLESVEMHYPEHWSVARYAQDLNITQSRLYELCQDSAGRSPKAVLNDRIVQEARRYLSFSGISMKELAGVLGFEDVNYFFRFFKRLTGETPSTCRHRIRAASKVENVQ